jgi:glycosyltransferase involved in cell wall biosynthesis
MNNSITVVIPLYNKEGTVVRCLNSIRRQTFLPSEVIIIDDGSTDDSLSMVHEWLSLNPGVNLNLISRENRGVAYTRNQGVSLAQNENVAFLDADDEWKEDFLFYMMKVIRQRKDFSMISCIHGIEDSQLGYYIPNQSFTDEDISYIDEYINIARNHPIVNSSKVVVNKKYFDKIGGFRLDAVVGEDLLLWIELSQEAPIVFVNKNLVTIRQQKDNSRSAREGVVPYPIIYYSKQYDRTIKNAPLMNLIWKIHINHLFNSLATNRKEASIRFRSGFRLFGLKNAGLILAFIPPTLFWRFIRQKRRKIMVKNYAK